MKKRILPIVLVLVMLLSLLPAQVFAASYTFDPNATIFTQNYTTETPRPNNLGDYFTVTSTPLSTADQDHGMEHRQQRNQCGRLQQ